MDERAKNKRKRRQMEQDEAEAEEEDDDDDDNDEVEYEAVHGVEAEKPGEGLKKKTAEQPSESNKKQKIEDKESDAEDDDEDEAEEQGPAEAKTSSTPATSSKSGKMTKKQQKMAAKKEKAKVKSVAKKAKKEELRQAAAASGSADAVSTSEAPKPAERRKHAALEEPESDSEDEGGRQDRQAEDQQTGQVEAEDEGEGQDQEGAEEGRQGAKGRQAVALDGLQQDTDDASARSHPDSGPHSPIFDTNNHDTATASTSTSVSSTVPPSEKPKHIKLPADMGAVRARLAAKIEALRAARKADGPDGRPIRTRQELIESRRAKQAQRKANRQETRRQARLEEQEKRERALASNSPSIMSPALELDGAGGYSFGRVAFGDGTRLSHDLTYVLSGGKRRGPSDPKTALLKVQNQKARLEELDDEKREDIAEKEQWLTARRRAEGEKIRNDEDLLKKAVKRKETAKKKSEQAWKDRSKGVIGAQKERQKKREENIKKRREDKMLGKAGKKKKAGGAKKARPGFEGSLGVGGRRK